MTVDLRLTIQSLSLWTSTKHTHTQMKHLHIRIFCMALWNNLASYFLQVPTQRMGLVEKLSKAFRVIKSCISFFFFFFNSSHFPTMRSRHIWNPWITTPLTCKYLLYNVYFYIRPAENSFVKNRDGIAGNRWHPNKRGKSQFFLLSQTLSYRLAWKFLVPTCPTESEERSFK